MTTPWAYSPIVKQHFFHPKNVLYESESEFLHNAKGRAGNTRCGDEMIILLQVENNRIKKIKWKTYGCASAIASTSMLSEVVKGMTLDDAYKVTPKQVAEKLGGLPPNKQHCSDMGDEALRNAIDNYRPNQMV